MTEPRCGSCRFFHRSNVISNPDACRRFPRFERRDPGDWCGEHEPAQAPAYPGPDDPVDWSTAPKLDERSKEMRRQLDEITTQPRPTTYGDISPRVVAWLLKRRMRELDASSPFPEGDGEKKEDDDEVEEGAENGDFLHPSVRARVRDELAVMVEGFDGENRPAWFIVDCILSRLRELAPSWRPGDSWKCSWERTLDQIKGGDL